MTGTPRASRRDLAPGSGESRSTPDGDFSSNEVTVVYEMPAGFTLSPGAARVILRVMKNVAAREASARIGMGRAG
jgi:hypothetical protein